MTNLQIKQNGSLTETVGSAIIERLYRLAITSKVEDSANELTMDLQGTLQPIAAYGDAVQYLREKFPNLTINEPSNGFYIRFKDSSGVAQSTCVRHYSTDGVGVTANDLAAVTALGQGSEIKPFDINYNTDLSKITTLPELQYFTGVSDFADAIIGDYSVSLSEVIFPKGGTLTWTRNYIIRGKERGNRIKVGRIDWNGRSISPAGAYAVSAFRDIDNAYHDGLIPMQAEQTPLFINNSILGKMIYPEGVVSVTDTYDGCDVEYIEFPTTLTDFYTTFYMFRNGVKDWGRTSAYGVMVFKSQTPPTFHPYAKGKESDIAIPSARLSAYGKAILEIYVPSISVDAYKQKWTEDDPQLNTVTIYTTQSGGSTTNHTYISIIKPLKDLPEYYIGMGTITQEDIAADKALYDAQQNG